MLQSVRYQESNSDHAALIPLRAIVEAGGGKFVGIQSGLGDESLVLFQHPNRTTCALALNDLSVETVRIKIAETSMRFAYPQQARSAAA